MHYVSVRHVDKSRCQNDTFSINVKGGEIEELFPSIPKGENVEYGFHWCQRSSLMTKEISWHVWWCDMCDEVAKLYDDVLVFPWCWVWLPLMSKEFLNDKGNDLTCMMIWHVWRGCKVIWWCSSPLIKSLLQFDTIL